MTSREAADADPDAVHLEVVWPVSRDWWPGSRCPAPPDGRDDDEVTRILTP